MASFGHEHFLRGRDIGRAEERAELLARLLEGRFGPLPARLQQRISTADVASIKAWFDLAIQAPDLQSVFGREN